MAQQFNRYTAQQQKIIKRQALADALRQQGMAPIQAQDGGRYVSAINPLQVIGKLASSYVAGQETKGADADTQALADTMQADSDKAFADYQDAMTGDDAAAGGNLDPMTGQPAPARKPNRLKAAALLANSPNPTHQALAARLMEKETTPRATKWMDVGGELVQTYEDTGERTGRVEKKTAAPQQEDRTLVPIVDPTSPTGFRYGTRAEARNQPAPSPRGGTSGGRLPSSALKMQQEELDAIGTAASIDADLGSIRSQIDGGNLDLGTGTNIASEVRNFAGASSENSRNYATFKATLERLRNDSLRLNKGVQTEGDSQRAWNELIANINDKELVKKRLEEIQNINRRAAQLRKMNVDNIRANYGLDPLETSGYENQTSVITTPPVSGGTQGGGLQKNPDGSFTYVPRR